MNKRKYNELSKNTLLFTISSFGSKLISFLLVPLYTYTLSTTDYGTLDLISTTVQLLIPILSLNIQDAILRYALDKEYDPKDVIGAGLKLSIVSSSILLLSLCVLIVLNIVPIDKKFFLFLFLSFVFGLFNNCISMYLKAVNKVKILTVAGLTNTFLTCLVNVILLLVIRMGVTGYLIANVIGTAVALIIMITTGDVLKNIKLTKSNKILKVMIPYSLPLIANSVAWWLNNASDRYILTFFCGVSINGIYSVAYKVPTILATIQTVFYNAWSISAIMEFDKDDKDGFIGNVYTLYSVVSFLGCSLLILLNIPIAKLLYAKEFFNACEYVPALMVGTVFNGLALFEGCIFTAVRRTKDVSKTTIFGAVVNTILNFILIPTLGATGAALATLIGYLTIWIMRTLQLRNIIKMKINWVKQVVAIVLLLFQLCFSIFDVNYWSQVVIIVLSIVIFKNEIKKIILEIYNIILRRQKKGNWL